MNNNKTINKQFKYKITKDKKGSYKIRINHILLSKIKKNKKDLVYFMLWVDNGNNIKIGLTCKKPLNNKSLFYIKEIHLIYTKKEIISPFFTIPTVLREFYELDNKYFYYELKKDRSGGDYLSIDII